MKELAPRDTGDLASSLRVTKAIEGGKEVFRVVSDDPNIKDILKGRKPGPVPAWRSGTPLGGWAGRHGFTTNKAKYTLARKIARTGTPPAGTFEGKEDWIKESLREAIR